MTEKAELIQGDCLEKMKEMESSSVDCVVTSPPYWALRDYGVEGQLGLEPTFQEYITKLCDIFDEVKRVLKDEGTCWVNIGDTYSNSGEQKNNNRNGKGKSTLRDGNVKPEENWNAETHKMKMSIKKSSVPSKSLCCIPDRFKIEMINRGWICRNEIIWFKPNCMPSSVKDRFTVDFEKVFFFVKQKKYFFKTQYETSKDPQDDIRRMMKSKDYSDRGQGGNANFYQEERSLEKVTERMMQGRNKRCVWQVATKPFKEAHFATYPEKLIEPMIDAGCPVGGIVLDPFAGAGTTGVVAIKQSKKFIGIELNAEYCLIAEKRILI